MEMHIKSPVKVTDKKRGRKQNIPMSDLDNLDRCLEIADKHTVAEYLGVSKSAIPHWKKAGKMSQVASVACLAFYLENTTDESHVSHLHIAIPSQHKDTITKIVSSCEGKSWEWSKE